MFHFNKFAAVALVAFLALSISWEATLCHISDCHKYEQQCAIHQGSMTCVVGHG
jgi:hypothetical protein